MVAQPSMSARQTRNVEMWRAVPYLADLPDPVIAEVATLATHRVYAGGETVFLEGDPCAGLFLVEAGSVKICRFGKDGRQHVVHVVYPGESFNEVAVLDGGVNPACTIAIEESHLWRVTRFELHSLAQRYPMLAWALGESIAKRSRLLMNKVQDLSMRNVRGRLARLLLDEASINNSAEIPRLLTQEEMASRLGTVREVVGRALRSMTDDGIVAFDRHHIVILDPDRLAREAEI